jgi:hypothetical protein
VSQYHHKPIKKFSLDGQIFDEGHIPRLRDEYTKLILCQMKLNGYVPRLDIAPDFTLEYEEKKQIFSFKISIYAVYVGKRKSEWIAGIDEHRVIYIPKNRLSEFSQEQV